MSNERIWQTRLSFTTTMNHRGKSRSVNVALLEGIPDSFEESHASYPATVSPLLPTNRIGVMLCFIDSIIRCWGMRSRRR